MNPKKKKIKLSREQMIELALAEVRKELDNNELEYGEIIIFIAERRPFRVVTSKSTNIRRAYEREQQKPLDK